MMRVTAVRSCRVASRLRRLRGKDFGCVGMAASLPLRAIGCAEREVESSPPSEKPRRILGQAIPNGKLKGKMNPLLPSIPPHIRSTGGDGRFVESVEIGARVICPVARPVAGVNHQSVL